ncbi:MAG: hypothetical protein JSW13_02700, partial [Candidatus Aerophobus sp.]
FSCVYFTFSYLTKKRRYLIWLAAAAFGYAFLTKTPLLILLPLFPLYLWLASKNRQTLKDFFLFFLLLVVVFFIINLWYNWARFGDLTNFGYQTARDKEFGFNTPLLVGLYGLYLSSGKGFFFFSPILILSFLGLKQFKELNRHLFFIFVFIVAILSLFFAKWWAWHGDWAWGPRFLVILVPFFMVPLCFFLRRFKSIHILGKVVIGILICVSIIVQTAAISISPQNYINLIFNQFIPGYGSSREEVHYYLRDDMLDAHFIPEFSQLSGQLWLFKNALVYQRAKIYCDHFSIRWSGELKMDKSDLYKIMIESDDGVRFWIDNKLVIDDWKDHNLLRNEAQMALESGWHPIKIEYYEGTGAAAISLMWSSNSIAEQIIPTASLRDLKGRPGLTAKYFDDPNLKYHRMTRTDPKIEFAWGLGSPFLDIYFRNYPWDSLNLSSLQPELNPRHLELDFWIPHFFNRCHSAKSRIFLISIILIFVAMFLVSIFVLWKLALRPKRIEN